MKNADLDPVWLQAARSYLGTAEVPGSVTSPIIAKWLRRLGAWWHDDETPWCGVFVATCFLDAGYGQVLLPKHWYRARAWEAFGTTQVKPSLGAVVVYERKGGGHVGFVVGRDAAGRIMTLGGNQGNRVSIAPFDPARVVAYRWPPGAPDWWPNVPILGADGASSENEA